MQCCTLLCKWSLTVLAAGNSLSALDLLQGSVPAWQSCLQHAGLHRELLTLPCVARVPNLTL